MSNQFVKVSKSEGVAVVTVSNPPVNALNAQTIAELEAAFKDIDSDATVRAVVVTGAGQKAFIAGADITQFPSLQHSEAEKLALRGQAVLDFIESQPKPVIAALNGFTLGGGCELAMACDLRLASETAKLGQPEINLGIIPGYGGTQRLTRLVGKTKAKELVFLGEMISAQEACEIGLVNKVVAPDQLMDTAMTWAKKLAAKAPLTLGLAKKAIDQGFELNQRAALDLEAKTFGETFLTEDVREGVTAFLEKRPAVFKGK